MSYAIVVTGPNGRPFFLVDEEGEPAVFDSEEEAENALAATPVAIALPSMVVELAEELP